VTVNKRKLLLDYLQAIDDLSRTDEALAVRDAIDMLGSDPLDVGAVIGEVGEPEKKPEVKRERKTKKRPVRMTDDAKRALVAPYLTNYPQTVQEIHETIGSPDFSVDFIRSCLRSLIKADMVTVEGVKRHVGGGSGTREINQSGFRVKTGFVKAA
jgi:hypothetical protein